MRKNEVLWIFHTSYLSCFDVFSKDQGICFFVIFVSPMYNKIICKKFLPNRDGHSCIELVSTQNELIMCFTCLLFRIKILYDEKYYKIPKSYRRTVIMA